MHEFLRVGVHPHPWRLFVWCYLLGSAAVGCTSSTGDNANTTSTGDEDDSAVTQTQDGVSSDDEGSSGATQNSGSEEQDSEVQDSNSNTSDELSSAESTADPTATDTETSSSDETTSVPGGVDVLGNNSHVLDNVKLEIIGTQADGLNRPTDVEIHPLRTGEAWVTSQNDHAMVVFTGVDGEQVTATRYAADGNRHFLARPSSLSFADNGFFATAHEEDQPTQGESTEWDFMGPTLWRSDLGLFNGGHSTHYDMLHNSPNAVGIAWEQGNVYWVFDGLHNSLTRYDFAADHGPGATDHSDGSLRRYVEGGVKYVEDVVSHLVYDAEQQLVYVADTGNSRIAVLDPNTGSAGELIEPDYDSKDNPNAQVSWNDAALTTLVDGSGTGTYLPRPAGLALHDDLLFVSDNEASYIYAFRRDGQMVDWLDTELPSGSLLGLSFDPSGRLYVVDGRANQLLRITAK